MRIIPPLEAGKIYHIYNRGVNSTDIFKEKRNYHYFLKKYEEYCPPVLETFCYALLKNHFHFLVKVKEKVVVERRDGKGTIELNASRQLSHFFNCYAQSFNKAYGRHGKLLEEPFRRKEIADGNNFTNLIYYLHFNPQLHGLVKDFRDWEFTSWHSLTGNNESFLEKDQVFDWFSGRDHFIKAHKGNMPNILDNDFD
jgi:putative transposase